jgi:preprotein translocase subunit SecY
MIFVCLFPQLAQVFFSFPFYLGGTSLLIVVSVVMDFISQSQSFIMSGRYSGLVKKAGISGV